MGDSVSNCGGRCRSRVLVAGAVYLTEMSMEYLKNVVGLRLDRDTCIGCGVCEDVCPHGVFVLDEGRIRIAERDACMECGACSQNCPVNAIFVQSGVGCAAAVINSMLGRKGEECCCGPIDTGAKKANDKGCCC